MTPDNLIIGGPLVPTEKLIQYLAIWHLDAENAEHIAGCYSTLGELTGIGNLMPFSQAVHESAGFTSFWWKTASNPAGIGVTGQTNVGCRFATPAEGIMAHVAHLLAYAATDNLLNPTQRLCVAFDPRLRALGSNRGSAPTWGGLDGRWAVPGRGYSAKICQIATSILAH